MFGRSSSMHSSRFKACAGFFATSLVFGAIAVAQNNPATTVSVDANANQHPISPNIYGAAFFTSSTDVKHFNLPTNRIGGNNESTYNWNIQLDEPTGVSLPAGDAMNLDNDWFFESYLETTSPGGNNDNIISASNGAGIGTQTIITIPMLPYIATVAPNANTSAASLWAFSVQKYGAQVADPCGNPGQNQNKQANDPYQSDAGSGIKSATGPDGNGNCTYNYVTNSPTDAYVPNSAAIQKAYVQYLVNKYGDSQHGGIKYYMLDNEPSIWSGTHRDVHPNPETYDELWADIQAYAGAIKSVDPNAIVIGPEDWSWWAMWLSGKDQANGTGSGSDYATHNNTYYYPWLLQQLAAYKTAHGINLIDVLSAHCYTDDYGNVSEAINTRELWDPTYQDTNWYTSGGLNGGVLDWIPLMQKWIQQYNPGLKTGCTEYTDWGDDTTLSGIGTQADMLGIFGYYGLDFANTFTGPYNGSTLTPSYLAFLIYRNYDGNLSTFGDTSVSTTVANPDNLSAFGAIRSSDGAMTVMVINKQSGSTPVTVNLAHFSSTGTAQAYQISSATQTSIKSLGSVTVANNAITATVPSQSITLYVIPAATVAPTAPTGLTASGGNAQVTLNWTASTGATSYDILRGTSAGGESATPIATGVTTVSYVDHSVTNGTTYYYEVIAVNGVGSSGTSNEASAAPSAGNPTFSATATASPNPATQNSSTTMTVNVTCTANSMTNGSVSIVVLDPNGAVAQTTPETSQSFTTNQTLTYSPTITPTLVGTYTVQVTVSGSGGQVWNTIPSAGTFTVNAAPPPPVPAFTITGGANPTTIAGNGSSTISAIFKNTGGAMTNGNLQIQVFNGTTAIGTYAPNYNAVNVAAGASQTLSFTWTPSTQNPPFTTPGTYNIVGMAFSNNYSTEYTQTTIGTITVTAGSGGGTPAFTITGGANPSTISANGSATISATFKNTGGDLTNGNLELQIYNGSTVIGGIAPNYNANNVAAGASQTLSFTWTPSVVSSSNPAVFSTPGTYNIVGLAFSSSYSTEYTQTTVGTITIQAAAPPPPAAPTNLMATAGNASVSLSWTGSTGATSYNVYRGTSSGGESTTPIATFVTQASYTDSTATNGTTYYYEVAAINSAGTSGMSNEASAKPQAPVNPTFTVAASSPAMVASGTNATSTVTVSSTNGYAGTVTIACSLTSSPANAQDLPGCSSGASTVTLSSGTTSGMTTVTVSSTAATAENRRDWSGGGAVLALLVLLGIPARRRSWRSMLCVLALIAAVGTFTGCVGNYPPGNGNPGTTSGTYTFTVTGTGQPGVTPAPSSTFTVTFQ